MDIDNLSVSELKRLEKEVQNKIQVRFEKEKEELRQQIRNIAKEAGTTVEELFGVRGNRRRGKVAPKYANPSNPEQTWTGRGRMPRWLQEKVDAGAKREDFLIK